MPTWLGPAASIAMILCGVAMLWFTWRRKAPRYYMFMAAGSVIGGLGGFQPADWAKAVFAMTSAACWTTALVLQIRTTWRDAKPGPASSI